MGLLYVITGIVILSVIPSFVYADSNVMMPVLVNIHGFEQSSVQGDDGVKWKIQKELADANTILEKCHSDFGLPVMRLGDPENEVPNNIAFVTVPPESAEAGGDTPEEREQVLREMARQGKSELNQRFGENRGQMIYVVSDKFNLGQSIAGSWDQGQIIWIKSGGVLAAHGADKAETTAGPYFLHELLHNTGLQENDHGHPGNVFHYPTKPADDRGITREQCDVFVEYFQNHGTVHTNVTRGSGFVALPHTTYYSLLVPLAEQTQHDSAIGLVEVYLDEDNWMTVNLVWNEFFSKLKQIETSVLIGLDLDDNSETAISDYLEGADAQIQIDIKEDEGMFYATGSYSATQNGQNVKSPVDYVLLNVASEGTEVVSSDSLRVRHEIESPNLGSQIPVSVVVLDLMTDHLNSYRLEMDKTIEKPKLIQIIQKDVFIPDWIKRNAGWWANGIITDSDFVQGIQYMIREGLMKVPATQAGTGSNTEIPAWIKMNAGWWAEGVIPDEDFVAGIQYLIEIGIIRL